MRALFSTVHAVYRVRACVDCRAWYLPCVRNYPGVCVYRRFKPKRAVCKGNRACVFNRVCAMCTRAIACHACAVRVALSLAYGAGVRA